MDLAPSLFVKPTPRSPYWSRVARQQVYETETLIVTSGSRRGLQAKEEHGATEGQHRELAVDPGLFTPNGCFEYCADNLVPRNYFYFVSGV